jgi:hypothetical protein
MLRNLIVTFTLGSALFVSALCSNAFAQLIKSEGLLRASASEPVNLILLGATLFSVSFNLRKFFGKKAVDWSGR